MRLNDKFSKKENKNKNINKKKNINIKNKKGSDTPRSREVSQPSTDEARDCLIARFEMELDVSSRVWPLQYNMFTRTLNYK